MERFGYLETPYIKYRQHGNNQVGTDKISHKFTKIEDVRNLFINVKLGIFKTYVENESVFPDDYKKLNKKAFNYYKMLNTKKYFNFKSWSTFYNLYKTEPFMYFIENFAILNLPCLANLIFVFRLSILKILKKR